MIQQHQHDHRQLLPDSIEASTPSKGGALKIYFDAGSPVDAERRIRNGYFLRSMLADLIDKGHSEKTFEQAPAPERRKITGMM